MDFVLHQITEKSEGKVSVSDSRNPSLPSCPSVKSLLPAPRSPTLVTAPEVPHPISLNFPLLAHYHATTRSQFG